MLNMAAWPVLVAEDREEDWFLLQHACKRSGIIPPRHRVEHGADAINYMAGNGRYADRGLYPLPNLIISDVRMPVADGFDFLTWLRAEYAGSPVPFIFLSTSASPGDIRRAYDLRANAFLTKPGSIVKFGEILTDLGNFWLVRNQLPVPTPPPYFDAA
jgi:CheY-like chemotaxis protein